MLLPQHWRGNSCTPPAVGAPGLHPLDEWVFWTYFMWVIFRMKICCCVTTSLPFFSFSPLSSLPCSVFRHAVHKCDLVYCLVGWRWKCNKLWLFPTLARPLQPVQLHLLVQTTLQSLQVSYHLVNVKKPNHLLTLSTYIESAKSLCILSGLKYNIRHSSMRRYM